ncbi:BSD domain-containing protein [Psidium guajava]|nr:BSD domain-containing protein [Psidium guajava]
MVHAAWPPRVQPQPWLTLPAPMQQTYGARVESPALAFQVVPAEPVLVPPVIDGLDFAAQDEQERRQGAQVIDPLLLLDRHPGLHLLRVPSLPPLVHVHHHHSRVEIARLPALEGPRNGRVRPEPVGEVLGEVGVAVLRGRQDLPLQAHLPELRYVVDHDEVRVEVDDPLHVSRDHVRQVDPRVVKGLVERLPDRLGDLAPDPAGVEAVDLEAEVGEGGPDAREDLRLEPRPQEVELEVLRAHGVLEDGEHRGHGAPEVVGVEGHGHVDPIGTVAHIGIAERRGLPKDGNLGGGLPDDTEADAAGGGGGCTSDGGGVAWEEEEDGQEAKEGVGMRGAPKGHPVPKTLKVGGVGGFRNYPGRAN